MKACLKSYPTCVSEVTLSELNNTSLNNRCNTNSMALLIPSNYSAEWVQLRVRGFESESKSSGTESESESSGYESQVRVLKIRTWVRLEYIQLPDSSTTSLQIKHNVVWCTVNSTRLRGLCEHSACGNGVSRMAVLCGWAQMAQSDQPPSYFKRFTHWWWPTTQ